MKKFTSQTRIFILSLIPTLVISILLGCYTIISRIIDLKENTHLTNEIFLLKEHQVISTTIIILILGILLSIFLAQRIARRLMLPLLNMREAVKNLEKGEFETRIHSQALGEIKELEEGINNMAKALQFGRDELNENIEQATSDLKRSLEIIEIQNIALAKAQKEALEGSRIKSEFIANMSHEIRTPMNGIIGFTNLLIESNVTQLQRSYLTTIQKSASNLLSLVNNILDFSRLDAGHVQLESFIFDIRDCIDETMAIMSPLAHTKQLEFVAIIDADVPQKIIGDPLRIKQIITNLISNSIKFTEKGDIVIHLTVEKNTKNSVKLQFSITDTGIGLSPKDQKNIFRAFQQIDSTANRRYSGTGLGLAICKKLVDQMAGAIGLESTSNAGSTFWFTFTVEKTTNETEKQYELGLTHQRIAIFDPHPLVRLSLNNLLASWHIDTDIYTHLDQLIEAVKTKTTSVDMIFIGINQYITRDDTLDKIILIRQHFSGPILLLSNTSEQRDLDPLLIPGTTLVLPKPISHSQLFNTIFELAHSSTPSLKYKNMNDEKNTDLLIGKKILCVDDNIQNAHLLSALLNTTQAIVKLAYGGHEAIELLKNEMFDIVLMDLRMPKMDGYETLKRIRILANQNQSIPVIASSAHITDHEYQELSATGFDAALLKPITKPELLKVIANFFMPNETQHHTTVETTPPSTQPVIDWNLAQKLANNNRVLAEEMIELLLKNLREEFADIKAAKDSNDDQELLNRVHRLHGAVCYCGVPRLRKTIALFETALKQKQSHDKQRLFEELEHEVNQLLALQLK